MDKGTIRGLFQPNDDVVPEPEECGHDPCPTRPSASRISSQPSSRISARGTVKLTAIGSA